LRTKRLAGVSKRSSFCGYSARDPHAALDHAIDSTRHPLPVSSAVSDAPRAQRVYYS
jgi:hypothetical protein